MDLTHLPSSPGVYLMRDASGTIIYIGKAKDLKKRVAQYFKKHPSDRRRPYEGQRPLKRHLQEHWKIPSLVTLIRSIDYVASASEREALLTERVLIRRYQPFFNEMWKDSKSYPYIKITREDFPRVLFTRSRPRDGAAYFGPYPKLEPLKKLFGYLWRIKFINLRRCRWEFSFAHPLNERKIKACLYFHTGQCPAPCAGKISKTRYAALAGRVADFFKGDLEKLRGVFRVKMARAAKKLAYEEAKQYRDFLSALDHMRERVHINRLPENFVAAATGRTGAVTALKTALALARPPAHIEAFDTSSLFGKQAVGSSVCFINGEKSAAHYRKYLINFKNTPEGGNDFAMMEEIVGRRLAQLKKTGEAPPDLLVIDGGPGQLAAAMKALRAAEMKIPVIGLAKRLEEIYTPGRAFPLLLERSHPGLRLLQALRDEAHRFGLRYHRLLRGKSELETNL